MSAPALVVHLSDGFAKHHTLGERVWSLVIAGLVALVSDMSQMSLKWALANILRDI